MRSRGGKDVLYPPVPFRERAESETKIRDKVVSLGRIHPEKRHGLQLAMARRFPNLDFTIIGYGYAGDPYVQKVVAEAATLPNVHLKMSCTDAEIERELGSARYFLHTMHGEHFGIAIAQAAEAGCTALIHARGGAPEISPASTNVWRTPGELTALLARAASGALPSHPGPVTVQEVRDRFSLDRFEREFHEHVATVDAMGSPA